ncbi:MAG: ATP-binding protein [Tannerellaceae bacterium]|nr:ATP-binding protein [Tannerellaceae bacterium]
MITFFRRAGSIMLLCFFTLLNHAESFRHIYTDNGLSSRRVYQVEKDATGFVWFFTSMGIDRFDGTEIRHYPLSETKEVKENVLPFSMMTCDAQQDLWVSLRNGKIYSYSKEKDEFLLTIDLSEYFQDTEPQLNQIYFDHTNTLWLAISSGLYTFDPENRQLNPIYHFTDEIVSRIIQEDERTYYAGTYQKVFQLTLPEKPDGQIIQKEIPLPLPVKVESMYLLNHTLYIGTFSNSVFTFDTRSGKTRSLSQLIPPLPVRTIKASPDNQILIGTDGSGVYSLDASNHQLLKRYSTHDGGNNGIYGNTVSDILIDERNCLWISTSTNGVSVLDPHTPDILWKRNENGNNQSLISDHVNVILEDSDGDIWYGTNNGISLHLIRENRWHHFLENQPDEAGQTPVILALCEDNRKNIWAGGFGTGGWKIDKQKRTVQPIPRKEEHTEKGLPTDYIYAIYQQDESIYFGGIEGELTAYHPEKDSYTYYPVDCIGDMLPGKEHELFLATCDGLATIDLLSSQVQWYKEVEGETLGCAVRSLLQTSPRDLFLATDGKGLVHFNPETGISRYVTFHKEFISRSIQQMMLDNAGDLWFSTDKNLYRLHMATGEISNMNPMLGIESGNFNPNASCKKKNGLFIVGTADGVMEFDPAFDIDMQDNPRLIFTDLSLFHKPLTTGENSPLKKAINETSAIDLSYNQNSFSLAFSSIQFSYAWQIEYTSKLEGFDKEWHPVSQERTVSYTNLKPGKYTLKVRALNPYSQENYDEKSLQIRIGKPFWKSGWAYFAYTCLLSLITLLILHYIRHKNREKKNQEKINTFVEIAHNIRTPISLIKAPLSEMESTEHLSESGRKFLALAMANTEKLFTMVTELLDFQKTELGNNSLTISGQELYGYMQEKLNTFNITAIRKNIRMNLQADFEELTVGIDVEKMDKIINNILSNAVKYTQEGTITIKLRHTPDRWSVEIKDTGIGIPVADQKNMFRQFYRAENAIHSQETGSGIGLLLTRKLVEIHQGEITFTSTENVGSCFRLTFPVFPYEETVSRDTAIENSPQKADTLQPEETVLIVEDNRELREYLTETLQQEYKIVPAENAAQALTLLESVNPDIIISDIIMPGMRGDEMCHIIKTSMETSHISVILLTALSEKENIIQGLESGADDYITKPFDTAVLKARIRNILVNRKKQSQWMLSEEFNPQETDYTNSLDKEFLDKAIQVIEKELSNPEFSINDFCRSLGMSRTSVYNKIKSLTDQGPNDFIRIIRLKKAKELLKSKKHSISDVALMVGFSDAKYFSTSFKKQFGVSPSKIDELKTSDS